MAICPWGGGVAGKTAKITIFAVHGWSVHGGGCWRRREHAKFLSMVFRRLSMPWGGGCQRDPGARSAPEKKLGFGPPHFGEIPKKTLQNTVIQYTPRQRPRPRQRPWPRPWPQPWPQPWPWSRSRPRPRAMVTPPLGHAAVHGHGGGGQNAPKICVSKSSKSMGGVAIAGCEPWTDGHGFSSEVFPAFNEGRKSYLALLAGVHSSRD